MKLGISTYTFTWSFGIAGYEAPKKTFNLIDLINIAKENGISLIQVADNYPLQNLKEGELLDIRKAAEENGIEIEIGTRGTDPELLMKYLEIAKVLHSNLVRTLITNPDIHEAEEDIRKVLEKYREAGVTIAIENHGVQTTSDLAQLFKNINSPFVGCCLDTVNSFGSLESVDQVLENLLPYTVNLHLKDFDIKRIDHQMGYVILGTPAGSGRLDIPAIVEILENREKVPNAVLELWTPYTNDIEETIALEHKWFYESVEYLQKLRLK